MKKTILVIGATGQQGGSVVRHLVNDGSFKVRALVRSLDKVKEHSTDVQYVVGDLNDVESLCNAMKNCYGVFGVTNF